jgi:hypothetical protein
LRLPVSIPAHGNLLALLFPLQAVWYWVPHAQEGFVAAKIVQESGNSIEVETASKTVRADSYCL